MSRETGIKLVESIGEEIGYGNLMSIASALWRRSLKAKGYPVSGAFIPTIEAFMTKEGIDASKQTTELYDKLISQNQTT